MMKSLRVLFCLILTALLCGCSPVEEKVQPASLLVGYSQLGSESAFRLRNSQDMQDAAKRHGVSLMFENANQKQEKQIEALRSFIAYRVDVITFAPIVETGWDNVLIEARNAGIPVIVVDRRISTEDESLFAGYVGYDSVLQGAMAGDYLKRKADDLGAHKMNIVEISGTLNSNPMLERQRGFAQTIAGDERFTMLESVSGDFLLSKGRECMEYLIDKYGDEIDVLFSHNDGMTLGAIEVMEQRGIKPGEDILILTVDGEQAAIDLLKEGKINCVVECTPHLGDLVMDMAMKLAAGQEAEREIYPEQIAFTDYDDLSGLAPRGY